MDDSVPLELTAPGKTGKGASETGAASLKMMFALFALFLFVVSDYFTESIISGFGEKAVKGRHPTSWGVVLQGIFLVILYALATHLSESGVL